MLIHMLMFGRKGRAIVGAERCAVDYNDVKDFVER